MKSYRLTLLLTCSMLSMYGQQISGISKKGRIYEHLVVNSQNISDTILLPFETTSISIAIHPGDKFKDSYILANGDTYNIHKDPYNDDSLFFSELIIFPKPVRQIVFIKSLISKQYHLHCINTGKTPLLPFNHRYSFTQNCQRPITIDQSLWRSGLPDPVNKPVTSKVKHIIIHHSEGRNDTTTDFTYVVRQIYIFHTESRGWNDIAYNFLVAQNGTIYEGRDGQGVANEEDVVGAHLCGKNTETMGICLLGNYETVLPTEAALRSTIEIISWKLFKEKINPMGALPHPDIISPVLPQVAGHRDGCNTLCPGKYVYEKLADTRLKADTMVKQCGGVIPIPPLTNSKTFCGVSEIRLSAKGAINGFFRWYKNENDTLPIDNNTDSSIVVKPQGNSVMYYVSAVNASGESQKSPVKAISINTNPPIVNNTYRIGEGSVPLIASGAPNGNYRWYDDTTKAPIANETNDTFLTPALNTDKTYYVSIYDGKCESSRTPVHVDILPRIYPNPTDGYLTVTLDDKFIERIIVLDSQGQQYAIESELLFPLLKMNLSQVRPGIYTLIIYADKVLIQKIVVL